MSLFAGLTNGARSLAAHQRAIEVAGKNLANVNTEGYSRQRVILGDRVVLDTRFGPQGSGVEALGVKQIRDKYLDAQVTREVSLTATLEAQKNALLRAQTSLGESIDRTNDSAFIGDSTGAGTGVSSALNDFFNSFDSLSASPNETGAKQVLLQKAATLVGKLNVSDSRLAQLQTDLNDQVSGDAESANTILQEIGRMNGEIAHFEVNAPGSAVDLRDQRQARLEVLAKYLDFTTQASPAGNGQIGITAKDANNNDFVLLDRTVPRRSPLTAPALPPERLPRRWRWLAEVCMARSPLAMAPSPACARILKPWPINSPPR